MYYYNPYHPAGYQHFLNESRQSQLLTPRLLEKILKSIKDEETSIEFYTRLSKLTPSESAKEDVLHALEDEKFHLKEFSNLYERLTGKKPTYNITPIRFNTFEEGLRRSYLDELEAYEFYRDIYLMTQEQSVRDVYLLGFTDEIEHATRFGTLLASLKMRS